MTEYVSPFANTRNGYFDPYDAPGFREFAQSGNSFGGVPINLRSAMVAFELKSYAKYRQEEARKNSLDGLFESFGISLTQVDGTNFPTSPALSSPGASTFQPIKYNIGETQAGKSLSNFFQNLNKNYEIQTNFDK